MCLKDKIKKLFYERQPNGLAVSHIAIEFDECDVRKIQQVVQELIAEGFIVKAQNPAYAKDYYDLVEPDDNYPYQKFIQVGKTEVPRAIAKTVIHPEDVNSAFIASNKFLGLEIDRVNRIFDNKIKEFWKSIATLFGIFIALFSLINAAVKPIYIDDLSGISHWELLKQSMCNLVPLSVVLLIFLFLLGWVLREKK